MQVVAEVVVGVEVGVGVEVEGVGVVSVVVVGVGVVSVVVVGVVAEVVVEVEVAVVVAVEVGVGVGVGEGIQMSDVIDRFIGEYAFLDPWYPTLIEVEGLIFPSVQHAFEAGKTSDFATRERLRTASKQEVRQIVQNPAFRLQEGFSEWRVEFMRDLLWWKFTQDVKLASYLVATHPRELIYTNYRGETFWGVEGKNGWGKNTMGILLMEIRAALIQQIKQQREQNKGEAA